MISDVFRSAEMPILLKRFSTPEFCQRGEAESGEEFLVLIQS